ncbi:MAG: phosphotransferase family protein [Dehalococcoidia bacterium]
MTTSQTSPIRVPTEQDAVRVLERVTGAQVSGISRFPTGLANYVYDVTTERGESFVVRLARPDLGSAFAGAVYWHGLLKPRGVPLPALLHVDLLGHADGFPAMVMERLLGTDLGVVHRDLTLEQKRTLAAQIVVAQQTTGSLPPAAGFGYARSYDDPALRDSWKSVVDAELERSRRRIERAGLLDPSHVDRVQRVVDHHEPYLARIESRAFLDDTTTKNVIVHNGALSGIVDVDVVCFGDRLFAPALTRMALLSMGSDTDYVDIWESLLDLTAEQKRVSLLYTACFCAGFMSELGQAFNTDAADPVDWRYVRHLTSVLARLLATL